MAMTNDGSVEPCSEHHCCLRARGVRVSPGFARLAGEWHLHWMPDDGSWFLVPPQGNVREIRVAAGADPIHELAVDGVLLDDIREAIEGNGLFPPC